jgi:hypothetical protein
MQGHSCTALDRRYAGCQGTNAPVPPEVAARLAELAQPRLVLLTGAQSPADETEFETDRAIAAHNATVRVQHTGRTNDRGVDAEAVLSLEGFDRIQKTVLKLGR